MLQIKIISTINERNSKQNTIKMLNNNRVFETKKLFHERHLYVILDKRWPICYKKE